MKSAASIPYTVHGVETALSGVSEIVCGSPLCSNRFTPGGMAVNPKLYCSDKCRIDASIIRRAAALLKDLSDEEALRVIR